MARRLIRMGVLRNPRSARNRRPNDMKDAALRLGIPFAEPDSESALPDIFQDFAAREVSVLAVDGGDGTVREVLTALMAPGRTWRPKLAILPSGKINLVARDVGWARGGPHALARLTGDEAEYLDSVRRPLLRIDRADMPPVFGMFLGAGIFTEAWRLANEKIHTRGIENLAAIPAATAVTAWRVFRGRSGTGWWMNVAIDDRAGNRAPHFLVLATTLHRLVFGIWPFRPDGQGSIHWLDIDAPPRDLPGTLPGLLYGRLPPWRAASGYRSGRAGRVELMLSDPVILDGEAFEPGADGRLILTADEWMEFVRP